MVITNDYHYICRKKVLDQSKDKNNTTKTNDNNDINNDNDRIGFGDILEMWQTQSFVIMIIVLDTFAAFTEIFIEYKVNSIFIYYLLFIIYYYYYYYYYYLLS